MHTIHTHIHGILTQITHTRSYILIHKLRAHEIPTHIVKCTHTDKHAHAHILHKFIYTTLNIYIYTYTHTHTHYTDRCSGHERMS